MRMIEAAAGRAQASPRTGSKSPVQGGDGLSPELSPAGSARSGPQSQAALGSRPQAESSRHSQEQRLPCGTWSRAFPGPRGMPQRASRFGVF